MPAPPTTALQTGIPGLDTLLDGGIPLRNTLVVTGEPGTGKTILCSQIAFLAAARGLPVVIATVTSEPHDKLLEDLSGFAFFRPELLGDQVFVISAYASLKNGAKEARNLILDTVRSHSAKVLFIDGLRSIRDLWRDESTFREFLYEIGVGVAAANCIALLTTEYP